MSKENDFREFGRNFRALLEGFLSAGAESEHRSALSPPSSRAEQKIADFPHAGIDGFLSHFVLTLQFHEGERKGQLISLTLPSAVQTVARSHPFIYEPGANNSAKLPLPRGSNLAANIAERDFFATPPRFFEAGKETILLQILNLDAKADTPIGPVRIILGETFKREYPDLFQPSFGAAQSLGRAGLPARLFFSPNGIIETPFGNLKTRPKALVGANISALPPVGSFPSLLEPVQLDSVDQLRSLAKEGVSALSAEPVASVQALAHPIDAVLYGEDVFASVETSISA